MYRDNTIALIEQRRAFLEGQRENSARGARCSMQWTTQGVGEAHTSDFIPFDLRFIEEPSFTSGMVLDDDTPPVDGHYPRVSVGVWKYQQNAAGHYVGAWLFFTVDTTGPGVVAGEEPNYTIHHHLVWEGKAIKDLPAHLMDLRGGSGDQPDQ